VEWHDARSGQPPKLVQQLLQVGGVPVDASSVAKVRLVLSCDWDPVRGGVLIPGQVGTHLFLTVILAWIFVMALRLGSVADGASAQRTQRVR
jgi:hypothetical protein